MKNFADLTEREVLAVAIASEEEDSRIYITFAEDFQGRYPAQQKSSRRWPRRSAAIAIGCSNLSAALRRASAADPPRGRRGFFRRRPIWLMKNLPLDIVRKRGRDHGAAGRTILCEGRRTGRGCRRAPPARRPRRGGEGPRKSSEETDRRLFSTPRPQAEERPPPHLRAAICTAGAGRPDGRSVSTLAPLFAAAFATHHNWETFVVGLAASVGAGISMGFAEALSDDGRSPGAARLMRGSLRRHDRDGGLGDTMPYKSPIAGRTPSGWRLPSRGPGVRRAPGDRPIRARYMATPFWRAVSGRARRRHRARRRRPHRRIVRTITIPASLLPYRRCRYREFPSSTPCRRHAKLRIIKIVQNKNRRECALWPNHHGASRPPSRSRRH